MGSHKPFILVVSDLYFSLICEDGQIVEFSVYVMVLEFWKQLWNATCSRADHWVGSLCSFFAIQSYGASPLQLQKIPIQLILLFSCSHLILEQTRNIRAKTI
jgi:hypothetical protein